MTALPTNVLTENANTSLLVMTRILAPLTHARAPNVHIPQRTAMMLMHALSIPAMLKLDARMQQLIAMTTTAAQLILATLELDAFIPHLNVMIATNAPLTAA